MLLPLRWLFSFVPPPPPPPPQIFLRIEAEVALEMRLSVRPLAPPRIVVARASTLLVTPTRPADLAMALTAPADVELNVSAR